MKRARPTVLHFCSSRKRPWRNGCPPRERTIFHANAARLSLSVSLAHWPAMNRRIASSLTTRCENALAALPTIRKVLEGVEARTIERINNAQINNVFVAADRFAEFVGQMNKAIEPTAHAGLKSYVRGS